MRKLIAVCIVFLFVVSIVPHQARAEGILTDFFDMIKKWFESSPFGNIFSMPVKRMETIDLTFYPEKFELAVAEPVNMSTNVTRIYGFKGAIKVDMPNGLMVSESPDSLSIEQALGEIRIEELSIGSLELKDMKLVLTSGNWTDTAENGSITIKDFLGTCKVMPGSIELVGNVSRMERY